MVQSKRIIGLWLISGLFLAVVLYIGAFNWAHRVIPENQIQVHGWLKEWSLLKVRKGGRLLRFTVSDQQAVFRIDPAVFREVMDGSLPRGLAAGAFVDVTVDRQQLMSPFRPAGNSDLQIVWVNGLAINGNTQLGVSDVVKHEERDFLWWFVLLAAALGWVGFAFHIWWKMRRTQIDGKPDGVGHRVQPIDSQ